jgi:hypothetical protein
MCNLYSITKSQTAIIEFTRTLKDSTGNLPSLPGIFPDYKAPPGPLSVGGGALGASEALNLVGSSVIFDAQPRLSFYLQSRPSSPNPRLSNYGKPCREW